MCMTPLLGVVLAVVSVADASLRTKSAGHDSHGDESFAGAGAMRSVSKPDPKLLLWDQGPVGEAGQVVDGTLTVQLDPMDPDSPDLKLRVRMVFASMQPAPRGQMLIHFGGPGTGAAELTTDDAMDQYDVWSISQRGIGNGAHPALLCNHSHLPVRCDGPCKISDFTDCPCAFLDGTPQLGEAWADIDPFDEHQVANLMTRMSEWGPKCYGARKFQLQGKNGRTYNLLDYVGTQYLVYDINTMRTAMGASKLSCYGLSYGTYVCGLYATVFSSYADKVVLDGNMDPLPQKEVLLQGDAQQNDKAIAKMLQACKAQAQVCSLKDPDRTYDGIVAAVRAGQLRARTKSGKEFPLQLGMLMGFLQIKFGSNSGFGWAEATQALAQLANSSSMEREKAVAAILDEFCRVKGTVTWYNYDICVGPGQTLEHEDEDMIGEPYIEQCAIWGTDMAGFYRVPDVMRMWRSATARYGEAGLSTVGANLAGYFSWPALASPTAPIGNSFVQALVVGNLFDPSTGYSGSQAMRRAFPSGAIVTWQGVGHLLPYGLYSYDVNATDTCNSYIQEYLRSGHLPVDGVICHETMPVPVG